MRYRRLLITARSVNRLLQTSKIAFEMFSAELAGTFNTESNRPAPAISFRSSRVELERTASNSAVVIGFSSRMERWISVTTSAKISFSESAI